MVGISKLKLVEIANRIPLFKALDSYEKEQVISMPNLVQVIKAGERFITFGDYTDNFYIVLSGSASVYQKDTKIAQVDGGQFVGEVGFICGEPRTATVIADSDLVTFCIDKHNFNHLPLLLRDKIKDKLINGLVSRVEQMNHQISALNEQVSLLQPHTESPAEPQVESEQVGIVQRDVEHAGQHPLSDCYATAADEARQQGINQKSNKKVNPMLTRITQPTKTI